MNNEANSQSANIRKGKLANITAKIFPQTLNIHCKPLIFLPRFKFTDKTLSFAKAERYTYTCIYVLFFSPDIIEKKNLSAVQLK